MHSTGTACGTRVCERKFQIRSTYFSPTGGKGLLVSRSRGVHYRKTGKGSVFVADEKARDIIGQLKTRIVCGDQVLARVGRRAWSRPRVAISARLYKQYRIPDPWDPNAESMETPIGLGPVSLRLGEKRRQPAPHLKPKPSKKEKKGLAERARAENRAPRIPNPSLPPKKKTPASVAPHAGTPLAIKHEQEASRAAEVAERMRAAEVARGPRPVRLSSRAETAAAAAPPSIPVPVRPDLGKETEREEAASINRPVRGTKRSDAGRFRMPRAAINEAPVVRSTQEKPPGVEDESTAEPPPRRRTMPSVGGGSMDDLFGAAAQMGRVSMRPSKEEGEE
jgi:hypothetical protein